MATQTAPKTPATPKAVRAPVDLIARTKTQLSTAVLKAKLSTAQLDDLASHITKLKALLA